MNKTLLFLSLTVLTVVPSSAQEHLQREAVASSAEKSFTVVIQLPVTSIKNQYRSGTCWDYATLAFLESEILRQSGQYAGTWYMSRDYMTLNTTYIYLNRHAISGGLPIAR